MFYLTASIAIMTAFMVVVCRRPVHALVYLIVSLLATAMLFFLLGAHLAAALEVIVYAGAIMMLFVFVIMILGGRQEPISKNELLIPSCCTGTLLAELLYVLSQAGGTAHGAPVGPQEVSLSLFGPYALIVEMAAFLLLAGLVGAYHIGREEARS